MKKINKEKLIKLLQASKHEYIVIDVMSNDWHELNSEFKIGVDDENFNIEVLLKN